MLALFFLSTRPPPSSTLFPYTTLFRSLVVEVRQCARIDPDERVHRPAGRGEREKAALRDRDRKSTRLNSSHEWSSYAVFCLKKKNGKRPCERCIRTLTTSRRA